MLYLITGLMGSGKTLNAIKFIKEDKAFQDRPVYFHRVQDLDKEKLGWTELDDQGVKNWRELPSGSVVLIDECDHVFPQRTKAEMPEYIRELKESRKHGIDIVFVTQQPMQLDVHVRRNIGHFIHLERPFGAKFTNWREWAKYVDPEDRINRAQANKKKIKLDAKYFGYYKSADQHTHNVRLPWNAIIKVGLFAFCGLALAYYVYNSFVSKGAKPVESVSSVHIPKDITSGPMQYIAATPDKQAYFKKFEPRIDDVPWTAPIYDEVIEVKSFPRPQCYRVETGARKGTCKCFTQQATPLDISSNACNRIVDNGYFAPFMADKALARDTSKESVKAQPRSHAGAPTRNNLRVIQKAEYQKPVSTPVRSHQTGTVQKG